MDCASPSRPGTAARPRRPCRSRRRRVRRGRCARRRAPVADDPERRRRSQDGREVGGRVRLGDRDHPDAADQDPAARDRGAARLEPRGPRSEAPERGQDDERQHAREHEADAARDERLRRLEADADREVGRSPDDVEQSHRQQHACTHPPYLGESAPPPRRWAKMRAWPRIPRCSSSSTISTRRSRRSSRRSTALGVRTVTWYALYGAGAAGGRVRRADRARRDRQPRRHRRRRAARARARGHRRHARARAAGARHVPRRATRGAGARRQRRADARGRGRLGAQRVRRRGGRGCPLRGRAARARRARVAQLLVHASGRRDGARPQRSLHPGLPRRAPPRGACSSTSR